MLCVCHLFTDYRVNGPCLITARRPGGLLETRPSGTRQVLYVTIFGTQATITTPTPTNVYRVTPLCNRLVKLSSNIELVWTSEFSGVNLKFPDYPISLIHKLVFKKKGALATCNQLLQPTGNK